MSKGFTLIETLITIAVIGVVSFILTDLLTRNLRGNTKTEIVGSIKQNGQSALNTIDQAIRFASSITCVDPDGKTLTLQTKDNRFVRFKFSLQEELVNLNGYIAQDTPLVEDLSIAPTLCDSDNYSTTLREIVYLTNREETAGASVVSGKFTRSSQPGSKDVVDISFKLSPGIKAGEKFFQKVGESNSISFQTSVILR